MTDAQAMELAISHHRAGRLDQAEPIYRQILSRQPRHAEALHMLGMLVHQRGQAGLAADLMILSVQANPNVPRYYNNLGLVLTSLKRIDEAVAALETAARMSPDLADVHYNLGNALTAQRSYERAVAAFQNAIRLNPAWAEVYHNLGTALRDVNRLEEAAVAFRKAIQIKPDLLQSHYVLGMTLQKLGELDDALVEFKTALRLRPDLATTYADVGDVLKAQGDVSGAIEAYRRLLEADPSHPTAHGNLLYLLHFHPDYDSPTIHLEHRLWQEQHADPLKRLIQPHTNDRDPERRLKVGYISPFFREHCQAMFTVPLLSHHDHKEFEIFCYSDGVIEDSITNRIKSFADGWKNTTGMPDQQVAEMIRSDGIDLLVDLSLHMADNRLLMFARKPAPVQISWLGYPSTTGLAAMDYRLTDPYLDPPGENDEFYSEQSIRLPHTFWCYDPLNEGLEVGELPAEKNGFITFGCLNNFCKVNDDVLRLWSQVLQAVPNSRFQLLAPRGKVREHVLNLLGVDPARVKFFDFLPRSLYLKQYQQIDICLDTFPYNGHTTTLDALWMGVPEVTLEGKTSVGRGGVSILSNVGLPDLIAHDELQFVQIASRLAYDLPRLRELRGSLRQRMKDSPLMDALKFTRNVEAAFRKVWKEWCSR